MSTIIDSIEQRQRRRVPRFDAGDRVRVHFQVIEGSRKRVQIFEGVVMKRQGSGLRETFTVRKQSFGVGVERTFPLHSPKIDKLEVAARGDVRRAKLYYLRDRVGKAARVAERRWGIEEELLGAEEEHAVDAEGVSVEELAAEAEAVESEDGAPAGPVAADDSPEDGSAAGPVAADAPSDASEGASEAATATPPADEAAPADEQAPAEEEPPAEDAAPTDEAAEEAGAEEQVGETAESGEGEDEAEEPAEDGEEAAG